MLIPRHIKTVAVDTETSGRFEDDGARVSCVAVAWEGEQITLPFDQGIRDKFGAEQGSLLEDDPNYSRDRWFELLTELTQRNLVFHNANFDLRMLKVGTRLWNGVDLSDNLAWDTMHAHRILFPQQPANLDSIGEHFEIGGKRNDDVLAEWLKKHKFPKGRYDLVPWKIIEPYVKRDAELTWEIYKRHQFVMKEAKARMPHIMREFDLALVLMKMENRGVKFNVKKSLKVAADIEAKADEIAEGMPFACDINSAKRYFFGKGRLAPDRVSQKTGKASLDKEQVRDWVAEDVLWAREYQFVSWARRACSMWYRGYAEKIGEDGRLRPAYSQGRVVSGRLSTERINLQAMPKADKIEKGVIGVRKLLQPRRGYELWNLDMSQAELRVAAKLSKCGAMLEALEKGADFHARTTEDALNVKPTAKDWKLKRDIGKNLTFAAIFGVGAEKFQRMLARQADIHISVAECDRMVRGWNNLYPEIRIAYIKANRLFEDRGWVKIMAGTEYEQRSYQDREPTSGWNRMVQGSIAAWMRMWLVDIEEHWPSLLVLTVHDSVLLEIPKKDVKVVIPEIVDQSTKKASAIFGLRMPVDAERY